MPRLPAPCCAPWHWPYACGLARAAYRNSLWPVYCRPYSVPHQAALRSAKCSCTRPAAAGLPPKTQHPVSSCITFISTMRSLILDHTEPYSHAPPSIKVRLHHICMHHICLHRTCPQIHPTPHSPCTPRPEPCSAPCPAPLSPCTTLHHTCLHHTRPAPHPGARSTPHCTTSPAPHRTRLGYTTFALHHSCPAPHPPCTILACTLFALHHSCPAPF